jgi:hypothetical protein
LARKGNQEFILEFRGLYHYHLKEGRKPKYSEKNLDDLFILFILFILYYSLFIDNCNWTDPSFEICLH